MIVPNSSSKKSPCTLNIRIGKELKFKISTHFLFDVPNQGFIFLHFIYFFGRKDFCQSEGHEIGDNGQKIGVLFGKQECQLEPLADIVDFQRVDHFRLADFKQTRSFGQMCQMKKDFRISVTFFSGVQETNQGVNVFFCGSAPICPIGQITDVFYILKNM